MDRQTRPCLLAQDRVHAGPSSGPIKRIALGYAARCRQIQGGGGTMSNHRLRLSDARFDRIQPLLPNKVRGVPRVDDRRVVPSIVHAIAPDRIASIMRRE